jgi:hypothetical protein
MAVPSAAAVHVARIHPGVQSSGPVIQTAVFVILGSLECVAGPGITASCDSFGISARFNQRDDPTVQRGGSPDSSRDMAYDMAGNLVNRVLSPDIFAHGSARNARSQSWSGRLASEWEEGPLQGEQTRVVICARRQPLQETSVDPAIFQPQSVW